MAFSDLSQFDYLYDALAKKYPGIAQADGRTSNFQFMDTPMEASWVNSFDAEAYNLANSTSTNLDGFFIPGNGFANAYKDLVLSIAPTAGSNNGDYRDCVIQIAAIDGAIQDLTSRAHGAFALYIANNPGTQATFAAWLTDPFGGQDFSDQLQEKHTQRNDFASTQANILSALDMPLSLAQKAVNPWEEVMNVTQGGQVQSVPLMGFSGSLADDVAKWTARPKGQFDFDVTISASDTVTSPWKTTYTSEVHSNCWGTSASVKVDTTRIITDNQYKLRVSAVGVNSYKINRGQWFDESLVSAQTKIVEGSAWKSDMFFGLKGELHLIPDEVFVMYRPTIQLTTSTETYKQEIASNADADVSYLDLMGFRFNISGLASLQPVGDEVTTTVTFAAPDNQAPQILGVVSKVVWNGDDQ